jgi:hypothetical protein
MVRPLDIDTKLAVWVTVAMCFDRETVIGDAAAIQMVLYLAVTRSNGQKAFKFTSRINSHSATCRLIPRIKTLQAPTSIPATFPHTGLSVRISVNPAQKPSPTCISAYYKRWFTLMKSVSFKHLYWVTSW